MGNIKEETYIKEIEKFIKEKTGINRFLSPKEITKLKKLFNEGYDISKLKEIIEKEINTLPPEKKRNFSLLKISHRKKTISNNEKVEKINKDFFEIEKWKKFIKKHKLPDELLLIKNKNLSPELMDLEIENNIIRYIWKKMKKKEKEKLQQEAIKEIKEKFLTENINIKRVLKTIVYRKIKEKYKIP
ncbi:hypothetical protein [Persephonella sp.]